MIVIMENTPITMPSIVRNERSLFDLRLSRACLKLSEKSICIPRFFQDRCPSILGFYPDFHPVGVTGLGIKDHQFTFIEPVQYLNAHVGIDAGLYPALLH